MLDKAPRHDKNKEVMLLSTFIHRPHTREIISNSNLNIIYDDQISRILTDLCDSYRNDHETNMIQSMTILEGKNRRNDVMFIMTECKEENCITSSQVEEYISDLKILAIKRDVLKLSMVLYNSVENDSGIDEVMSSIDSFQNSELVMQTITDKTLTNDSVLDSAFEEIREGIATKALGGSLNIKTNLTELDAATGGFRGGQSIVIAGRPGMGKSTVAVQIALNVGQNRKVDFYAFEMKPTEIVRSSCIASSMYELNMTDDNGKRLGRSAIRDYNLTEDQLQQVEDLTRSKYNDNHILWNESFGWDEDKLFNTIRANHRQHNTDCVIIDYLQLIESSNTSLIREQQVSKISKKLKSLSLQLDVPIIDLSQLNRQADSEKPIAAHLRESGSIEQDADMILMISRPIESNGEYKIWGNDDFNGETVCEEDVYVSVVKNRGGKTGDIRLKHNGEMSKLVDPMKEDKPYEYGKNNFAPINRNDGFESEKQDTPFNIN